MTNKEKLKKIKELADAMYNKMQNLTTDTSGIRKAMEEYRQFVILEYNKEEPVEEDLEDITQKITYEGEVYTRCYKDKLDEFACKYPISVPKPPKRYAKYSDTDLTIAVKAGAKWQKEYLALTWEDINRIEIIIKDVYRDYPHGIETKQFGVEVLNRFNKLKEKKS